MEHEKHGRPGRPGKHDDDRELHHVFHKLEDIESKIDALGQAGGSPLLAQILTNTEQIMATQAEISAKVDELQVALDTKQAAIEAGFATLNAKVDQLASEIVAGGTEAERQASFDKLVTVIADVQSTMEGPSAPPVP